MTPIDPKIVATEVLGDWAVQRGRMLPSDLAEVIEARNPGMTAVFELDVDGRLVLMVEAERGTIRIRRDMGEDWFTAARNAGLV